MNADVLSPSQSRASPSHTHSSPLACHDITHLSGIPVLMSRLLPRQTLNLIVNTPDPAVRGHLGLLEQVEMEEQLQPSRPQEVSVMQLLGATQEPSRLWGRAQYPD